MFTKCQNLHRQGLPADDKEMRLQMVALVLFRLRNRRLNTWFTGCPVWAGVSIVNPWDGQPGV